MTKTKYRTLVIYFFIGGVIFATLAQMFHSDVFTLMQYGCAAGFLWCLAGWIFTPRVDKPPKDNVS